MDTGAPVPMPNWERRDGRPFWGGLMLASRGGLYKRLSKHDGVAFLFGATAGLLAIVATRSDRE